MFSMFWLAISGRIRGLVQAADLQAQFMLSDRNDGNGVEKYIGKLCNNIFNDIEKYSADYNGELPTEIEQAISSFIAKWCSLFAEARSNASKARAAIVLLAALEAEITYLLSDQQAKIQSRTERAFLHLQRSLAADEQQRSIWQSAFCKGETACEKLGASHLLLHGIYAFKVGAEGASTDLILSSFPEIDDVAGAVDGLVLTEWKVASCSQDANKRYAEAKKQAQSYADGVLAGIELNQIRYLVVVTEKQLPNSSIPPDEKIDGVSYRHINLAINPDVPSVDAKKQAKQPLR